MHAPPARTLHSADSAVPWPTGVSLRTARQPQWAEHRLRGKLQCTDDMQYSYTISHVHHRMYSEYGLKFSWDNIIAQNFVLNQIIICE